MDDLRDHLYLSVSSVSDLAQCCLQPPWWFCFMQCEHTPERDTKEAWVGNQGTVGCSARPVLLITTNTKQNKKETEYVITEAYDLKYAKRSSHYFLMY